MKRNTVAKVIAMSGLFILGGGMFANQASASDTANGTLGLTGSVDPSCLVTTPFNETNYTASGTSTASGGSTKLEASDQIAIDCNTDTVDVTVSLDAFDKPAPTNATNLVAEHRATIVTTGAAPTTNVNDQVKETLEDLVANTGVATNPNGDVTIDITSKFVPPSGATEDGAEELFAEAGGYAATFGVTVVGQ